MGPTHEHPAGHQPPRDGRDRDGYGHGGPADMPPGLRRRQPPPVPPHGRVPMPAPPPEPSPRGRPPMPPQGRARVRPPVSDDFDPLPEPSTFVARARVGAGGDGSPGQPGRGGRHTRGRSALPGALSLQRSGRFKGRVLPMVVALVLLLGGGGVVGGSAFLDSVTLSTDLSFPETTTVLYSDGSVLARLGSVTRYELPYEQISDVVKKTIVASEDESFWEHDGVDFGGVMRAAWNNFTGGQLQGGSTITQQYARLAYDLGGVTYQRKAREAVLAWKMDQAMSKEEILAAYLNAVPFGRQAYGVEAAARAFFGKTANNTAPPEQQLTMAEAMVLVAMVKQPYPDPDDPIGSPGYDPTVSAEADTNARSRFEYVRGQLVAMGSLPAEEAAALVFPDTVKPYEEQGNGMEGPGGHIVNQVLSELTHTPGSMFSGAKDWKFIKEGGYQIHTTIHPGAQDAAWLHASRNGSVMSGQPANLQSALVAVQPGTGRVLAYYGGDEGTGNDFAGTYLDQDDVLQGFGYHPPGSSFKVYTLAAALKANFALRSYWKWNPYDMQGASGENRITNVSTCGNLPAGSETPCSLLQSTVSSLNVPFYQVTLSVGPGNVLSMARDAGIDAIWTDGRERIDLRAATDMNAVVPAQVDTFLGIGQYPVTVVDHANGMATMAAAGQRADVHFVTKVMKGENIVYGEKLRTGGPAILTPQQVNDLTYALSQVSSADVNIGWDTAGKTGTWEYGPDPVENAHAWMVGFSRRIAAAVWVGNAGDEGPIRDANGQRVYGSGLPASIWQEFMTAATAAMAEPQDHTTFNQPNYLGDTNPPGSVPSPTSNRPTGGPNPTRTRR